MASTVLGIFLNQVNAEDAVSKLENLGYNPRDISIVIKDKTLAQEFSSDTGTSMVGGALSGATVGGAIGVLAGLLAATTLPGLGVFFIGGPIAAALGFAGTAATAVSGAVTGAAAGGLIGALTGLGLSNDDAKIYEESIKQGGILLAVPARLGEEEEVRMVLADYGANQIRLVSQPEETVRRSDEMRREFAPAYFSEIEKKDRRIKRTRRERK